MNATVISFTPSGAAIVRPDGSPRRFFAHQNIVRSYPTSLDIGDRVNVRIAKDRSGQEVVTEIAPAH